MKIVWEANVDEKLLKKQRRVLAGLLYGHPIKDEERGEALEGVLSILEALQDKLDDDAAETKGKSQAKTCEECGRKLKNFVHNCPANCDMPEIYGCPKCDDVCSACQEKEE
jgi:hypothetical protein